MKTEKVDIAFNLIERFLKDETIYFRPIAQELLTEAERLLSLKFPASYKYFISQVGHGGPGDLFIPGIRVEIIDELKNTGVVWSVLTAREKFDYPTSLISIYDHGDGTSCALDTARMDDRNECPVVDVPSDIQEEDLPFLEIVAPDFGTFFLNKVLDLIEDRTGHRPCIK